MRLFDELWTYSRDSLPVKERAYQKITDVFRQCSYDYDKDGDLTKAFY